MLTVRGIRRCLCQSLDHFIIVHILARMGSGRERIEKSASVSAVTCAVALFECR